MRNFIDRWYGDRCPAWTWPATIFAVAAIMLTWALIADQANQAECEKKGGNTMKGRACYHVTMKKID